MVRVGWFGTVMVALVYYLVYRLPSRSQEIPTEMTAPVPHPDGRSSRLDLHVPDN